MALNVREEILIERPRETVAAFVMDPANDLRWIGALVEVENLTDGPVAVGSRVKRVAKFLGKRVEYVNEIDELTSSRRLAMHSVKAPFDMRVAYSFEDAGDGTRVAVEAGGETGGYYRLAGPLLPLFVRMGIKRDLRQLKKVLETGG
jgi:carbon monoxide dehydrogenase subunit G